jgi:hypothetical protein
MQIFKYKNIVLILLINLLVYLLFCLINNLEYFLLLDKIRIRISDFQPPNEEEVLIQLNGLKQVYN